MCIHFFHGQNPQIGPTRPPLSVRTPSADSILTEMACVVLCFNRFYVCMVHACWLCCYGFVRLSFDCLTSRVSLYAFRLPVGCVLEA